MSESYVINFKKNDIICKEGAYEMFMYDILSGSVAIYKDYGLESERKIGEASGGYIGEMGLLDSMPRTATVVANEDVEAAKIDEPLLIEYFRCHPDKISSLMICLAGRMREISNNYTDAINTIKECLETEESKNPKSNALMKSLKKFSDYFRSLKKR